MLFKVVFKTPLQQVHGVSSRLQQLYAIPSVKYLWRKLQTRNHNLLQYIDMRYVADLQDVHFSTPRRAKRNLKLVHDTVKNQKRKKMRGGHNNNPSELQFNTLVGYPKNAYAAPSSGQLWSDFHLIYAQNHRLGGGAIAVQPIYAS